MSKAIVVVCSVRPELNVPLRMAFAQLDVDIVDVASIDEALIVVGEHKDVRCVLVDQCDFDDEARLISANILAENNEIAVLFLGVKGASVDSMAAALEAGGAGYFRLPVDVGKVVAKLSSYLGCELPDLVGASLPGYELAAREDLPEPPPLLDAERASFSTVTSDLSQDADWALQQNSSLLSEFNASYLDAQKSADSESFVAQEAESLLLNDVAHTEEIHRQEIAEATASSSAIGEMLQNEVLQKPVAEEISDTGTPAARSVKNRVARLRKSREKSNRAPEFEGAKTQVFSAVDQNKLLEESRESSAAEGLANILAAFDEGNAPAGAQPLEQDFSETTAKSSAILSDDALDFAEDAELKGSQDFSSSLDENDDDDDDDDLLAPPPALSVDDLAEAKNVTDFLRMDLAEERVRQETAAFEEKKLRIDEAALRNQAQTLEDSAAHLSANISSRLPVELAAPRSLADAKAEAFRIVDEENARFLEEQTQSEWVDASLEESRVTNSSSLVEKEKSLKAEAEKQVLFEAERQKAFAAEKEKALEEVQKKADSDADEIKRQMADAVKVQLQKEAELEAEKGRIIEAAQKEARFLAEQELQALRKKRKQERARLLQAEKKREAVREKKAAAILEVEREKASAATRAELELVLKSEAEKTKAELALLKEKLELKRLQEEKLLAEELKLTKSEVLEAHQKRLEEAFAKEKIRQEQLEKEFRLEEEQKIAALHQEREEALHAEKERIQEEYAEKLRLDIEAERKEYEAALAMRKSALQKELQELKAEQKLKMKHDELHFHEEIAKETQRAAVEELERLRDEFQKQEQKRQREHDEKLAAEQKNAQLRYEEMLREARKDASKVARIETEAKLQTELAQMAQREAEERIAHENALRGLREDEAEKLKKAQEDAEALAAEEASKTVQMELERLKETEKTARQHREDALKRNQKELQIQQQKQIDALRVKAMERIEQETQLLLQKEFAERQMQLAAEAAEDKTRFEEEQLQTLKEEERAFLASLDETRKKAAEEIERSYQELQKKIEKERRHQLDALKEERAEEEALRKEVQAGILKEAAEKAQASALAKAKNEIEEALTQREERRERLRAELSFRQGVFSGDFQDSGLALLLSEVGGDPWIETHALLVGEAPFSEGGGMGLDPDDVEGTAIALEPVTGTFLDGEILALLFSAHRLRITGVIDIVNEDGRMRSLFFEQGEPVGFDSQLQGDRACEHLLRAGLITSSRYTEMRAGPALSARRACSTLVDDGGLLASELFTAVRGILTEQLMSVAAWDRGSFHYRGDRAHEADRVRLQHSFDVLLAEACRRKFDEERLWKVLGSPSTLIGPADAVLRMPPLSQKEQRTARLLDGKRALDDVVLETGGASEVALCTALLLVSCGACRVIAKGLPRAEENDLVTHSELERERVADRLKICRHGDYFSVLGVERDATAFEIRTAATRLRNRFNPERFSSPALSDLKRAVQEIRDIIAEAEDVLSDDDLRNAYGRNTVFAH